MITRRNFLKALGAIAVTLGLRPPALDPRRKPYVSKGEVVSYIGHCPGGFIGAQLVVSVGEWDGVGYPVTTRPNGWSREVEVYYDCDLADFNREVPMYFWRDPHNRKRFPNVHTYVRVQRFGEGVGDAIRHLNFASIRPEDYEGMA